MTDAVKDMALVERPAAISVVEQQTALFERFVTDPNVDVEKLERLMAMHERARAQFAVEQFNAAMSAAQTDMRPIAADADNPQTRSRYASYSALDRALRPIYTRNGFGLSFDTGETALELHVRVLCYVTHVAGHARTYHVDMPADGKGAKGGDVMTRTHAVGSAMSYGMRYLLKMIFNVAVGEDDDDGNRASAKATPQIKDPAGYRDWLQDLACVAESGTTELHTAWNTSKPEFRRHLTSTNPREWERIKTIGTKATANLKQAQ